MAKTILISINPKWVAKILNGEKTIEIRKCFPKDYVGWVYIYCTKNGGNLASYKGSIAYGFENGNEFWEQRRANGKVVARFWCDKVEEIKINFDFETLSFSTNTMNEEEILEKSCLSGNELENYLLRLGNLKGGYAIHITKLEIFDKPKELSEFMIYNIKKHHVFDNFRLTLAPQSWCYIYE